MSFRLALGLAFVALWPTSAFAQPREATLLFRDGTRRVGKVIENREVISDPSGITVSIPASGAFLHLDDQVRRTFFSYSQVQDVIPKKPEEIKDLMVFKRPAGGGGDKFMPGWEFESATPWNHKWERTMTYDTKRGRLDIDQRITLMTPHITRISTVRYDSVSNFLTVEMGPDAIRGLLVKYYSDKKELKEPQKRVQIAKFLYQVGWYDYAERELENLLKEYRDQQKLVETLREAVKEAKANWFLDNLEQARKVGQHATVLERIESLDRDPELAKRLDGKFRARTQDLKNYYDAAKDKIAQTKQALKDMPAAGIVPNKAYWEKIAGQLSKSVNHDTVSLLETFTTFAQQHLREVKENRKPTQKVEEVMALAVTGWLQGNSAAEPDVKLARQLWAARGMILDLQKNDNPIIRGQMANSLAKEAKDVPFDMLARLIKMLPPPVPYDKIDTEVHKLDIDIPDGQTGSYHVQLPPDYHPLRAYPVVLLLHGAREKPAEMIARFTELGAHHGYIIAASNWGKGLRPSYAYSPQEHALVLDTLRDLRRRFSVDSDRVFLLGWEQGGDAAYDIGLSHPDQFAGVLPMNGRPQTFSLKYHTNGQYLPFYAVDGDQNGISANPTRTIFKDWVKWHYPSLYVEYKGRSSEWYGAELISMFDWMNRKKRHEPRKELGRHNTSGLAGEEFKTMRSCDNKFYWLGCDSINERSLNDHKSWDPKMFPATLTGSVHTGNELVVKAGAKDANIWNQINIRASNVKQVRLWLTPNLIDYSKPLTVRINGAVAITNKMIMPSVPTMLEEFYQYGDRQRLVHATLYYRL